LAVDVVLQGSIPLQQVGGHVFGGKPAEALEKMARLVSQSDHPQQAEAVAKLRSIGPLPESFEMLYMFPISATETQLRVRMRTASAQEAVRSLGSQSHPCLRGVPEAIALVKSPLHGTAQKIGVHVFPDVSLAMGCFRRMRGLVETDQEAVLELALLEDQLHNVDVKAARGKPITAMETAVWTAESEPIEPEQSQEPEPAEPEQSHEPEPIEPEQSYAEQSHEPEPAEPEQSWEPMEEDDGGDDRPDEPYRPVDLGHYTLLTEEFAEPPEDLDAERYWLCWERVDCVTIAEALRLDAVRRCPDSGLFDVLYSFSKDGIGWVPVLLRPGRCPPGMRGRIFCGPKASPKKKAKTMTEPGPREAFIEKLPAEIRKEMAQGVPEQLIGRSAFAFKKVVRYIVRCRLDSVEVDISNAFYQLLHRIVPLPETLAEYLAHRDAKLQHIGEVLLPKLSEKARRREAKKLLIRLGFGGSLANWAMEALGKVPLGSEPAPRGPLASWLYRFETQARRWHTDIFETMSDEAKHLTVYAHGENLYLGKMRDSCGSFFNDHQNDGIGVLRGGAQFVVAALPDIQVAVQELEDPWLHAAEKYPKLDWSLKASMQTEEFAALRQRCRQHVLNGRARQNTVEFAKLAAALLAPVVHVPVEGGEKRTTFESFERHGHWLIRSRDDLGQIMEELMANLCRPVFAPPDYIPPYPLNDNTFFSGLSSSVLGRLAGPALPDVDGDGTRYRILLSDGALYDFQEKIFRSPVPGDRMGFRASATSKVWEPPFDTELFVHIKAFLLEYVGSDQGLLTGSETGKKVIECFEALQSAGCELLAVLKAYRGWDSVLYDLRTFARAISACPRFCEMYYFWGGQSTGKDTKVKLLHRFLGGGEHNYAVSLPGNYVVAASGADRAARDAASPYLARTRGKRLIWCSEVPAHEAMADGFVKPWCEMQGAPITGRKLHTAPVDFTPQGILICTSNSPPKPAAPEGMDRRLRVYETSVKFVTRPDENSLTQARAVDDLKGRIQAGIFDPYILYFAIHLVDTLVEELNPGTELKPQPPEMKLSADEPVGEIPGPGYVEMRCRLVHRSDASLMKDVLHDLRQWSGENADGTKKVARTLGIKGASWGAHYIATVMKDGNVHGLQLKPQPVIL
ncbi:unnamed protein product, partial [Symbiodinium sp. CCMP2592]